MTRALHATMQGSLAAESDVYLCHLLELRFAGGTVRYVDLAQNLQATTPDGTFTWQGVGGNIGWGAVDEGTDLGGATTRISLTGVDPSVIPLLLGDKYLGRIYKIYRVHVDKTTGQAKNDPVNISTGRMNAPWKVTDRRARDPKAAARSEITIETAGRDLLGDLEQVRGIVTNLQSHQEFFAGDLFFAFIPTISQKPIFWGQKDNTERLREWARQSRRVASPGPFIPRDS